MRETLETFGMDDTVKLSDRWNAELDGSRALPADSLEYLGETADGNTALPVAAGAGVFGTAFLHRQRISRFAL